MLGYNGCSYLWCSTGKRHGDLVANHFYKDQGQTRRHHGRWGQVQVKYIVASFWCMQHCTSAVVFASVLLVSSFPGWNIPLWYLFQTVRFKSYLLSLGISDPVTRDTHGSGDKYHRELAKEISRILESPLKARRSSLRLRAWPSTWLYYIRTCTCMVHEVQCTTSTCTIMLVLFIPLYSNGPMHMARSTYV